MKSINAERLAHLANCLMEGVNISFDDNEICVAEFADRYGTACQLHLVVREKAVPDAPAVNPALDCTNK